MTDNWKTDIRKKHFNIIIYRCACGEEKKVSLTDNDTYVKEKCNADALLYFGNKQNVLIYIQIRFNKKHSHIKQPFTIEMHSHTPSQTYYTWNLYYYFN